MYNDGYECKDFFHVADALRIRDRKNIEMFVENILNQKMRTSHMLWEIWNQFLLEEERLYAIFYFGKIFEKRYSV